MEDSKKYGLVLFIVECGRIFLCSLGVAPRKDAPVSTKQQDVAVLSTVPAGEIDCPQITRLQDWAKDRNAPKYFKLPS